MDRMSGRINGNIGRNLGIGTDSDFSDIKHREVVVRKEVFPDLDIIAVIAVKRSFNIDVFPCFPQDLFEELFFLSSNCR